MTKWWSVIVFIVACGGGAKPATTEPAHAKPPALGGDPSCPMVVAGVSVAEEDSDKGGALVFVTTGGDYMEVRRRAGALVAMYGAQTGPAEAMGMMISAGAQASVEEVPNGAKVVFVAPTPDKVGPLQNELRMHAGHLQPGSCKMAM
jgi:phosphohistidine swiveling domain-containing protein